jgi:hypothetical protein
MFHPDYKGSNGWGAGGDSGWANNGTTAFASGTTTGAPGTFAATFAAAFSPANTSNAAAVASARVANIGASNNAARIVTAGFTLGTGTVNFGASMSATAGGSDAPFANTLASASHKRRQSDEETAYLSKRSRRN